MRTHYKNPAIHKAFDRLEEMSADEQTRLRAEIREKALKNEVSMLAAAHREGEKIGIEKGIEKGEALLLQRLLVRRFGTLPSDVVGQIAAANAAQLELWGDRVLDAASLEEVF